MSFQFYKKIIFVVTGVNVTEYMLGSSANNILIDGLLDRIKYFHSRELILNSEESQKFTEMLLNRSRVNATRELTIITGVKLYLNQNQKTKKN